MILMCFMCQGWSLQRVINRGWKLSLLVEETGATIIQVLNPQRFFENLPLARNVIWTKFFYEGFIVLGSKF